MLSILSEVHFWTLREDISIKSSDFGAFRYYDKKANEDSILFEGKKSYAEKRGLIWAPQNKRPLRLKDNLRELEEQLSQQRVAFSQWRDSSLLQLLFSSGLFVNIHVNVFTGEPVSITFDKFLVGKLLSDYIADVVLTKSHLICSYNDSQLTLVYFAKPTLKRSTPKSFNRLDPRLHTIELAGPAGRRLERKLACNVSGDMVVAWWYSSHDEVYPWSPIVKDQDRANVLVYGISGLKAELLCHHRSEFELISVSFSLIHSNIIRLVEQKVSRNGDVTVESSLYQISRGNMQRTSAASISLPTHMCCHGFSPLQDKLLLGCIDGSLVLYDESQGVTHVVKAAFIPSIISWHPDGGVFVIANERCQCQILDAALGTLKQQLLSEDVTPGNLLDITSYFRFQPTLRSIRWNKKAETNFYVEKFAVSDCLLLLLFERGPLASLRFVGGGGLAGDIHNTGGFTIDSLVAQYLWVNQVDRAINLLLTLNWDVSGNMCLSCLQRIVNHLFKLPLTPEHEVQIQTVLGCFHMPVRPMCPATVEEFKAPVRDITRRFFHHLLRYKLFEKAFRLAIDLMDRDLFMDIHFSAKLTGKPEIADAAYKKAEELETSSYGSSSSASSHSDCRRSSCSECSESASIVSASEEQDLADEVHNYPSASELVQHNQPFGKSGTDKHFVIPTFGAASNSYHPYPPLPVLTNPSMSLIVGVSESGDNGNLGNKSVQLPVMRGQNGAFQYDPKDFVHQKVYLSSLPRPPTVQNDKPKVKFSDTVTQITLPDRLHTLPEEEDDAQSSHSPQSNILQNPKSSQGLNINTNVQRLAQSPLSSFTYSANSVGIPIVPTVHSRFGLSDNRNLDANIPVLPSYLSTRIHSHIPESSASSALPWEVASKTKPMKVAQSKPSLPIPLQSLASAHLDLRKSNHTAIREVNDFKVYGGHKSVNRDNLEDIGSNDSLGTEELSALLPGSRKPFPSGTHEMESRLPSAAFGNGPQKLDSIENTYFINYSGTVQDLSEEEESSGSIKIVHFGVV